MENNVKKTNKQIKGKQNRTLEKQTMKLQPGWVTSFPPLTALSASSVPPWNLETTHCFKILARNGCTFSFKGFIEIC